MLFGNKNLSKARHKKAKISYESSHISRRISEILENGNEKQKDEAKAENI